MHVELKSADRVGDVLYGVALAVGEVVHRVDAPLVARAVVRSVLDAVKNRVAEHHVRGSHVDLRAENLLSVSVFSGLHVPEQTEVLLHGAVPVRALGSRLVHGAASLADLLLGLVIDVGLTALDHLLGPGVKLVEIVGSVKFLVPLEAEPLDVLLDRIDIFSVLLGRVGVVKAEVGLSAVLLGEPEVDADALRVSEMEVPVRLRRETCHHALNSSGLQVVLYYLLKKVESFRLLGRWIFRFFHCSVSIKLTNLHKNLRFLRPSHKKETVF